jgi:hypothetical protein
VPAARREADREAFRASPRYLYSAERQLCNEFDRRPGFVGPAASPASPRRTIQEGRMRRAPGLDNRPPARFR